MLFADMECRDGEAIDSSPEFAAVYVNLALLYQSKNRHDEALTCLERGLEKCPGQVDLLRARARFLAQQRRFHEARECLTRIGDVTNAQLAGLRGAVALLVEAAAAAGADEDESWWPDVRKVPADMRERLRKRS